MLRTMFHYTHLFIYLNIYYVRIYAWARSCCSVLIEGQETQTVDDIIRETDP